MLHSRYARLWASLIAVIAVSFGVLGYYGYEIYLKAPPVPSRVVSTDGSVVFDGRQIFEGQNVWQSIGGQEVGSIWGHGAYVAPDWSADWLHREATWILDRWAVSERGMPYKDLSDEAQAGLQARLRREMRANTYDPSTGAITVSPVRAEAIRAVAAHYDALFGANPSLQRLRDSYAIPVNTVPDPGRRSQMASFFFWTAWACVTNRPGQAISYTSNWPPESLVGNSPIGETIVWSVISFVVLLAGVGALAWYFAVLRHRESGDDASEAPDQDPLLALNPTPSMKATLKYFWVVAAL